MSVGGTFGCMLIGILTASALWGLTAIQTWYYYAHYPKDPWKIKLLVGVVLVMDTIHEVLISHMIYTYLIIDFGNYAAIDKVVWSLIIEVCFNGITALLVQCFMTYRIYKLSNGNIYLAISAMVWVITGFVLSIVYSIQGIHIPTFAELPEIKGISMSVNAVAAAGDLYIAVLLCYLLQTSRTGFQRSDSMIRKLIVFSINTGLLTSICALCSLVTYAAFPQDMIYISFYYNIGRLYSNSFLATLNARRELRGLNDEEDMGMSMSLQSTSGQGRSLKRQTNSISIKIDTTKEFVRDGYPIPNSEVKNRNLEPESD